MALGRRYPQSTKNQAAKCDKLTTVEQLNPVNTSRLDGPSRRTAETVRRDGRTFLTTVATVRLGIPLSNPEKITS